MMTPFMFNKQAITEFLSKVHKSVLYKVNGIKYLNNGEWIGSVWRHDSAMQHSGQLNCKKILPNGNAKYRLITVLDNPSKTFAMETKVVNKHGQLVSASSGLFHTKANIEEVNALRAKRGKSLISPMGTESYVSTYSDSIRAVKAHADKLYAGNPNVQKMFYGRPRFSLTNIFRH